LLERCSQPSGNLHRDTFNLPQRNLFESGSPFGFNCGIELTYRFGTFQVKLLLIHRPITGECARRRKNPANPAV
jgi:hypothetical protein